TWPKGRRKNGRRHQAMPRFVDANHRGREQLQTSHSSPARKISLNEHGRNGAAMPGGSVAGSLTGTGGSVPSAWNLGRWQRVEAKPERAGRHGRIVTPAADCQMPTHPQPLGLG